jgi:holo-[acyl-carrier protein] synthase
MILGHGIDIVDLTRFQVMDEHRLKKIASRICTDSELKEFNNAKIKHRYLAKIWAGKEAIAKAFGTGIRGDVTWKTIFISSNNLGKPEVYLKKSGMICYLSFSHDRDYLIASAILSIR